MSDEYDFDYGRAHELLSIVQLVAEVAPSMTAISSEAMAELKEINQDILDNVKARKQAEDEAAAQESAQKSIEAADRAEDQGEDVLGETPVRTTPTQAEINEAKRRSTLAKQSLDTTTGTNTAIRRTL